MSKRYTEQELIEAVKTSVSIRQVLIKLGLAPQGGSYQTIHNAIQRLHLDTSHFLGQASNKGQTFKSRRSIDEYLYNQQPIQSYKLKNRLLKDGYFERRCYKCTLAEWNGQPIPLELEHIDGNPHNNHLSNLTILCPNCHAQTSTYRGKNIK